MHNPRSMEYYHFEGTDNHSKQGHDKTTFPREFLLPSSTAGPDLGISGAWGGGSGISPGDVRVTCADDGALDELAKGLEGVCAMLVPWRAILGESVLLRDNEKAVGLIKMQYIYIYKNCCESKQLGSIVLQIIWLLR
jgi:hypothetical protein